MNYLSLISEIANNITSNNANQITGEIVRNVLSAMVASLGRGYQFMGFATPTTDPGTPDQRVFYVAQQTGTYVNFNNLSITGISFLIWDTQWIAVKLNVSAGGGGSTVQLWPLLDSGVRIANMAIDGIEYHLYAPSAQGGGSIVSISNLISTGIRLATLTIDGIGYIINMPSIQVSVGIGGTNAAPTVVVQLSTGHSDSTPLPVATKTKSGIVSTGNQVFGGNKTFDRIYLGNSEGYGMYIDFDDTLGAFRIHGDVYATGDIAAGE